MASIRIIKLIFTAVVVLTVIAFITGSNRPVLAANTITVTNLNDSGVGSLRQAITDANSTLDGVIIFNVTGTIVLITALPGIAANTTVMGPGESQLIINGGNTNRVFFVNSGTVTIEDLTIANGMAKGGAGGTGVGGGGGGAAGMGGGLFINQGSVTIMRVNFQFNQAVGGAGGISACCGSRAGGGGGGVGGDGGNVADHGGNGGDGGVLGGTGGPGSTDANPGGNGGTGAGGGGASGNGSSTGGNGGFGGGGGGAGGSSGGSGGFGGGGGGGGTGGGALGGNGGSNISSGGGGGAGLGGAIYLNAGTLILTDCTFQNNQAIGGLGGGDDSTRGQGKGGALFISQGTTASAINFINNDNSAMDGGTTSTDNQNLYGVMMTTYYSLLPIVTH